MASALHLMKHRGKHMDLSHGMHGVGGVVLDTGIEFGAGYALGQVYHRYGDRKWGQALPYATAIAGKLGAVAMYLATGDATVVGGALNAVGSVGVAAVGLDMGLRHARKAKNVRAVLLPKDAALPAGGREVTSMGELPPAPAGKGLSWDQVEQLAAMH